MMKVGQGLREKEKVTDPKNTAIIFAFYGNNAIYFEVPLHVISFDKVSFIGCSHNIDKKMHGWLFSHDQDLLLCMQFTQGSSMFHIKEDATEAENTRLTK